MSRKSLSQTNPYLKDHQLRLQMIRENVISSTAIEGVTLTLPEKASISSQKKPRLITPGKT